MDRSEKGFHWRHIQWFLVIVSSLFFVSEVFAAAGTGGSGTIGTMASSITKTFSSIARLVTAGSYIAGLGFAVGAIMKFKAHKDNPTQITIGTPISLIFIAAALLFLPSILSVVGYTMFGSAGGIVAGPTGFIYS